MVDRDGRNFRSFYYETLGLRNVEQKKALAILLKDNPIDLSRVATFSCKFSLPAVYRTLVWKILLGVLPPYQDAHPFVEEQRREQCKDLKHALQIMQNEECNMDVADVISKMYVLQEGGLCLISIPQRMQECASQIRAVVEVFVDMFEDFDDLYWLSVKFIQLQQFTPLDKMAKLLQHYLQTEDSTLFSHLNSLGAFHYLPYQRWFESSFAKDLPDTCMERIWDKVVAGSTKILVIVGVALLLFFKHSLMGAKSPKTVTDILEKTFDEDTCLIIVNKAMELWDTHGATVISEAPTVH
ncbi:predicted protein [Nematostella vectensis]|uniref:TBC1 domain family member 7 n=1 Tax=Nematostella vectensis TaxID=45351 RepID=A7SNT6_NEMVE|nr:predicted protein [Nematostella vectensis]|eukprot:XP_001626704.1 predicted protein [Nematostella vectensis]